MPDSYNIRLTAPATTMPAGSPEPIALTVAVAARNDGQPADDGVEVSLSTDLGYFGVDSVGDTITERTLTLADGTASCPFYAGNQTGTAEVLALIDESFDDLTIEITSRS